MIDGAPATKCGLLGAISGVSENARHFRLLRPRAAVSATKKNAPVLSLSALLPLSLQSRIFPIRMFSPETQLAVGAAKSVAPRRTIG
jgi:hypothetical protein